MSDEREKASISMDDLPSWDDLAYGLNAQLLNNEIGCSGEYETTMRLPDGTVITNRDRLVILDGAPSAGGSSVPEQPATEDERAQVEAWFAAHPPETMATMQTSRGRVQSLDEYDGWLPIDPDEARAVLARQNAGPGLPVQPKEPA